MDRFDMERLQVYRRKIFNGEKLTAEQTGDLEDLKKRHAEMQARIALKEEREIIRRQMEEKRKAQREFFQQQRELLLLSRRIPPCVEGKAWQIDTASNTSTKQSSVVSRHDVSNNSFCKEGPSPIEKLYSPKRASNLGLHSLNLPVGKTQSDRDKEAHQNLIQLEYSTHKQNQLCSTQRSNSSTECTAKSEILDRSNKTTNNIHDIQMPCRSILDRTKSYDEVNMSSAHAEGTAKEAFDDCQAIYIETFDIMLSDINGPLGKGCGGLRRYFYKLLENIVSTGCIYRTANKIGICVHGTVKSLGIVRSVLEHASQGSISGVTWKFRSTGRSLRHGQWKKMFTTKLCENAASGRYSPQKNSLLMQNKIIGRMK